MLLVMARSGVYCVIAYIMLFVVLIRQKSALPSPSISSVHVQYNVLPVDFDKADLLCGHRLLLSH